MTRRLRFMISGSNKNPKGESLFRIGVAFGYWPCLKGPFLQLFVGFFVIDVWFGLESYKRRASKKAHDDRKETDVR